jgi:hypothetical protein
MNLRQIAVRVAGVTMKDPAMQALEKRHDATVTKIWTGLEEYREVFKEMQQNKRLSGEILDFAKIAVEDASSIQEKVRSWGDDFRSIKHFLGEYEDH